VVSAKVGGIPFANHPSTTDYPSEKKERRTVMLELATNTLALGFGASAGGGIIYLLCGGGLFGAVVIFFILRMVGGR
jgi:hypothetical protein